MALLERSEEVGEIADIHVRGGGELVNPGVEAGGLVDGERLVGPEGGEHGGGMPLLGEGAVILEIVHGVVGGADDLDVHLFQEALGGESGCGELGVGLLPDAEGIRAAEQLGDAEVALQFEVGPVVERVPQRVRNGLGPGEEFLLRGGVAGDEFLGHAVAAHGAPFVMIALEPDLKEVLELAVLRDVARGNMAVVVEDGFRRGVFVIQPAGRLVAEQKIFMNKGHNRRAPGRRNGGGGGRRFYRFLRRQATTVSCGARKGCRSRCGPRRPRACAGRPDSGRLFWRRP